MIEYTAHADGPEWRLTGSGRLTPSPFLVAAVVNITPDSFSDGGDFFAPEAAVARTVEVVAQGADMVDLGAESTRPGAPDIGQEEELRRLMPVLEAAVRLRDGRCRTGNSPEGLCPSGPPRQGGDPLATPIPKDIAQQCLSVMPGPGTAVPGGAWGRAPQANRLFQHSVTDERSFFISIDTWRSGTAAAALEAGADIVNDVSGCRFDPDMVSVLAEHKPGYVLGHSPARPEIMQHNPHYDAPVLEVLERYFTERMNLLVRAGLPEAHICLDPCIGFGQTLEHTTAIFRGVARLAALGRPLYYGVSRKSSLVGLSGRENPDRATRDGLTQAVVALLASRGVHIHRVHNVPAAFDALRMARAFGRASQE